MIKTLAFAWLTLIAAAHAASATTYIVMFKGSESAEGFEVGGSNLLNLNAALGAVTAAGGVVTSDMTQQMGVAIVSSSNPLFTDALRANPLVEEVGPDAVIAAVDRDAGSEPSATTAGPGPGEDPLEFSQWDMQMVHAPEARAVQKGRREVTVAVIDTGIDVTHQDFFVGLESNIDIGRARSFVPGDPSPLVPSAGGGFAAGHGTVVAGLVAARQNGLGIVGVAPNVTIVPIKAVDNAGFLFESMALEAIRYAGDIRANVINMSWDLDADAENLENSYVAFFCRSDPAQRAVLKSMARAIHYARYPPCRSGSGC